jgi:hypothetical protein
VLIVEVDVAADSRSQAPSVLKRWRWYMSDFIDLFHDSMCALSVIRRERLSTKA